MSGKILSLTLWILMALPVFPHRRCDFPLLINFTCELAKDELEKHPEMRTIAMVELENNFPSDFSAKVLKCLPNDVTKVVINPHTHVEFNNSVTLPKQTMVIYVADKVELVQTFVSNFVYIGRNHPSVHHLSKHLIVSSANKTSKIFASLHNVAQIYVKSRQVIAKNSEMTRKFATVDHKNLSQILFPDKIKSFKGHQIHAVYLADFQDVIPNYNDDKPLNKWTPYLDIIAEKLEVTINYTEIEADTTSMTALRESRFHIMKKLIEDGKLDFYLNFPNNKFDLESYNKVAWCFMAPVPKPYSITELILFLPMDKSCWMWLGITIAVSTLIWRISEGHWNFAFGAFAYFMGQEQLSVVRTNRLTMKILLQLLIFTIFIFSNGYQSLVTSFMLEPEKIPLLKSTDEVLSSHLKIERTWQFDELNEENPKYQKAMQDGRVVDFDGRKWIQRMHEIKLACMHPCKISKMKIETLGDGKTWMNLYMIPEELYSLPGDLYTKPFHPLLDFFQELMDRSLEAGLHQAWERFFWEVWKSLIEREKLEESEQEILNFSLIAPFFLILVFGFGVAVLALWCEIFCKDFLSKLTRRYFMDKFNRIFKREIEIEVELD